jgi:uncharacterized protein (TIGR00255 family)
MLKSMTGFASMTSENEQAAIGVTVRSVNHRYLDLQVRVPPPLADLEARLRGAVQRRVARGRVEVTVSVQARRLPPVDVQLNEPLLDGLVSALDRARARGVVAGPLTPGDLLRVPQALTMKERAESAGDPARAEIADAVEAAVANAVAALDAMRVREGEFLRGDLEARRCALTDLIDRLAGAAAAGQEAFRASLAERVREATVELRLDAAAVAQEVVRLVARSDISEEVVRFRAHLEHWATLVASDEPCGRKLDFLLQEMNREINTIGAKAEGDGVAELVVDAKAELERMREQVQNVE